jgi:predicted flavoprotein YhiN
MMLRLWTDVPEGSMVVVKTLPDGGFNFQWAWASGHCAGLFV